MLRKRCRRVAKQKTFSITRLVVLGTRGSMWDVLVRQFGGADTELETALWDAAVDNRASEALLAPLAKRLAAESGLAVELRIIPYVTDLAQAFQLVETVARCVRIPSRNISPLRTTLRNCCDEETHDPALPARRAVRSGDRHRAHVRP
jgi:hypothetical protein